MLSERLQYFWILFTLALLFNSESAYSQTSDPDSGLVDTTDYVPFYVKGAIDYNLMIASSKGYSGEVNRLVMLGADVFSETDQGVTPLIFAVAGNHTKVAKMLIDFGSEANKQTIKHETPLLIAVKNQNAEIVEALLRAGADIDFADKFNATPLHYASAYGYLQITDMLLYYEASTERIAIDGTTPLLASIWAGNADISDLLIQNGAKLETSDNDGFTPFLMSALRGDTTIMQLLFKKGANIYAINNSGNNALALTIIGDQTEATAYLLKIGDNWGAGGKNSVSPYRVASKYRRKDMIKLLEENKVPGHIRYEIDQVDVMASSRFSAHDIYTGISLSFKEPYLNAGIIAGVDTKLWYTRVLLKQSEYIFYQYMDRGSVLYGGLFKNFSITNYAYKANLEISASLSAGYSFGNRLKGTLNAPRDKLTAIPALSLIWIKNNLSFSLGADYLNTDFYHIGPVWVRFGASYNIYFDKVRTKSKTLKWY
jgi:ankyrin repeat protein